MRSVSQFNNPQGALAELPQSYIDLVYADATRRGLTVSEILGVQEGIGGKPYAVMYNVNENLSTCMVIIPQ